MSQNEQIALRINQSLHRFPLILDILEEIHQSQHVGDEDLEHGSLRAIQSMLDRLRKIPAADPQDRQTQQPTKPATELTIAEQIAGEWLLGERPKTLLPAPILSELESLICRLLPGLRRHPKNPLESPDPREQAS